MSEEIEFKPSDSVITIPIYMETSRTTMITGSWEAICAHIKADCPPIEIIETIETFIQEPNK